MTNSRKERKDCNLSRDNLGEEVFLELRTRLLKGEGHGEIVEWLGAEGIDTAGPRLSEFWKKHCKPIKDEADQLAAVKAEGIIDGAGRTDWNAATMELVKQVSFEMMSGQRTDPKTAEKFIKLILKADKQDQDREKLKSAAKSKIEEGLDALLAEIKGNKKAEAIFAQLQEVVKAA
jgi:thiol-disulfide isomerase/thioredoxin